MACSQTLAGLVRDCNPNVGGIKRALIALFDDVTAKTLDTGNNQISAITMASTAKFKEYYVRPETSSATETPQYNDAGEYAGEEATISLVFGRRDATKRAEVKALSVADLVVILEDANGNYWYYGFDFPVNRNGGDAVLGQARTDRNAYNVQLRARDLQTAYLVDSSIIAGLLA